jgi:hypothetical protein
MKKFVLFRYKDTCWDPAENFSDYDRFIRVAEGLDFICDFAPVLEASTTALHHREKVIMRKHFDYVSTEHLSHIISRIVQDIDQKLSDQLNHIHQRPLLQ